MLKIMFLLKKNIRVLFYKYDSIRVQVGADRWSQLQTVTTIVQTIAI